MLRRYPRVKKMDQIPNPSKSLLRLAPEIQTRHHILSRVLFVGVNDLLTRTTTNISKTAEHMGRLARSHNFVKRTSLVDECSMRIFFAVRI